MDQLFPIWLGISSYITIRYFLIAGIAFVLFYLLLRRFTAFRRIQLIEQLMGKEMDLAALYPDRELFHETEYVSFQRIAIEDFLEKKEEEEADRRLSLLEEVSPDHPVTGHLQLKLAFHRMAGLSTYYKEEVQRVDGTYDREVQTEEAPKFYHEEILQLYEYGLHIDHDILRTILNLPRERLITDLESVVEDAVYRYEFFQEQIDRDGWKEEKHNFLLHALYLLSELESEESLEVALYILSQGSEFLEKWLGDFLLEQYWLFLYKMGRNQLEKLKTFVMEAGNATHGRMAVFLFLTQLGLHHQDRREEISQWLRDVSEYFLENKEVPGLIDHMVCAEIVSTTLDLGLEDLDDVIKQLFDEDMIDVIMVGDWEDYLNEKNHSGSRDFRELRSIFDQYDYITSTWAGYREPESSPKPSSFPPDTWLQFQGREESSPRAISESTTGTYRRSTPKVGRNDPCPCGSGKKYKKCCM